MDTFRIASVAVLTAIALCGCRSVSEPRPAEYPLRNYTCFKSLVMVRTATGVSATNLVDLAIFGAFHPSMTASDAQRTFGDPARTWTDDQATYYAYQNGTAEIRIMRYEEPPSQNDDLSADRVRWLLYAYPFDNRTERFLQPALAKLWKKVPEGGTFIVSDDHGPIVRMTKKNRGVESIRWQSRGGW